MLGRAVSAIASRIPASSASRSLATSPSWTTCQPYASKRFGHVVAVGQLGGTVDGDVVVVVDVDRRPSPRWPAIDAASWLTPSSRSPSPQNTKVWWSTTSSPNRARRLASASPMPTPLAKPWPSGPVVTSMPGTWRYSGWPAVFDAPLAEVAQVVEGEAVAGEVEQRVEEHRRVAVGEHEPVAVGPVGRGGVVLHDPGEEHVGERCQRHRRAGVTRVRLLHRVHRRARGSRRSRAARARARRCRWLPLRPFACRLGRARAVRSAPRGKPTGWRRSIRRGTARGVA